MNIALIVPDREYQRGGVADYTVIIGKTLSSLARVQEFTGCTFTLCGAFSLANRIVKSGCTAAVLQYTPNIYRWRSLFAPVLLLLLRQKGVRTLTVFHELFLPAYKGLARNSVQRPYNFFKDLACLTLTRVPVVTFQHRARFLRDRYGLQVRMLPVCSNIPAYEGPPVFKEFFLGSLGSFHHDFDLDTVFEAMRRFPDKRPLFIGNAPPRLHAMREFFTGYCSPADAARQLMKIRYFVLCDKRGISLRKGSTAAALAAGLCVIATRSAWTDDLFIHDENVFFFDGTADGLATAIQTLEAGPDRADRIARAGRELYNAHMAPGIIARGIAEALA
ncbi:MAG: hypothetical protein A2268_14880 [Candidatus Raymondbacteria bacterium RifOxyA12_full_50_37]|nr:MAG: hypothetical protein A2268_14880 [Candidatus Raymondbacteria bacterium RifOxyA12_full_50_37]OGJ87845.1 MAG: hypothetical protein A2350_12825 [Candidatus Raymondbacteria bacterium RifOxyB12_full_50_8]OGJ88699.1 MAG: hypothetical protein A2248_20815 [Candidatus Raymondbacteria bacterium RIFOXYA2_FULL_49_16]OGK07498.1 MAG: hypothetical protein A2487_19985 [Candidatus Raymondbacteria bacterium RifOxyC12_full_50_8]OGP41736.1 MAG: hypothetical protein A2324_07905 [Candidatus Raymondbacteria b